MGKIAKALIFLLVFALDLMYGHWVSADSVHPFPKEALSTDGTKTCCRDGFGLNYTIPMFDQCKKKLNQDGSMIQTIPKLIPDYPAEAAQCRRKSKLGIPSGRRVCRFPDCLSNPCRSGWCEETMTGFQCYHSNELPDDQTDGKVKPSSSVTSDKPNTTLGTPTVLTEPYVRTTATLTTSDTRSTTPMTTEPAIITTSQLPANCTTVGWVQGVGKCYLFPNIHPSTWSEAKQYCEDLDSVMMRGMARYPSLMVPESNNETEVLKNVVISGRLYWINCERGQENVFSCKTNRVGGTTEYRNWNDGEPNVLEEECAFLGETWWSPYGLKWYDYLCDERHVWHLDFFFACQFHLD